MTSSILTPQARNVKRNIPADIYEYLLLLEFGAYQKLEGFWKQLLDLTFSLLDFKLDKRVVQICVFALVTDYGLYCAQQGKLPEDFGSANNATRGI